MRLILASGQSIELVKDTYSVGRAANSDVVISDPSVSRAHCRLSRTNAGWVVEDLSSQNGTFVNDKRIARATPLREGDVVRVGAVGILTAASQVQPAPARAAGAHAAAAPPASGSNSRALVLGLAIIGGAIVLVMLLFVLLNLNSGTGSGQPTVVSFALTAPPATETEPAEPTAAVLLQTRSLLATTSIQQPTTRPRTPAPPPTETEAPGITATPPFDTPGGFLYAPPELFDPPDGRELVKDTVLRWRFARGLNGDEEFQVLAWREGETEHTVLVTTRDFVLPLQFENWHFGSNPGKFYWTVRVRRPDGTLLSAEAIPSSFLIVPKPPPTEAEAPTVNPSAMAMKPILVAPQETPLPAMLTGK